MNDALKALLAFCLTSLTITGWGVTIQLSRIVTLLEAHTK